MHCCWFNPDGMDKRMVEVVVSQAEREGGETQKEVEIRQAYVHASDQRFEKQRVNRSTD